jgi:conjugative relaxase-like TrwC/TraI family protein
MFTMAKIKDGSTYLKNHLTANDYYNEKETTLGEWVGIGSEVLGFHGNKIGPKDEIFESLRKNENPFTQKKLTQRTKSGTKRIAFYDFQLSAPKSISIMGGMMEDIDIKNAHAQAAQIAFKELESLAAKQKNKGPNKITGNVIAAKFEHDTSRALDPQMHTHFVVANATFDPDTGKCYGLETEFMCRAIRYCGVVYTNELARVVQELGYSIRETIDKKGNIKTFEISGVSEGLCERYSKRRAEVEKGIAEFKEKYGREPSPTEIHDITTKTRSSKLTEISTPEVRAKQKAQLSKDELSYLSALQENKTSNIINPEDKTEESINYAIEHIFERNSVVRKHTLMAEALKSNLGSVDLEALKKAVNNKVGLRTINKTKPHDLFSIQTTEENLKMEKALIRFANNNLRYTDPISSQVTIPKIETLNQGQKSAYEGILGSRSRVLIMRGAAGTGKSFTLQSIENVLKNAGISSFYMAPTKTAAGYLKSDGLENATTLSDFICNGDKHHGDALKKSIFILDEAGMASTKQMHSLFSLAHKSGARIFLVGDTKQHSGVEAGDSLAILEEHSSIPTFELTEVLRQKNIMYRKACEMLNQQKYEKALNLLDKMGWIKEGEDFIDQAASLYVKNKEADRDTIMIAPTWPIIDLLNEKTRKILMNGYLKKEHEIEKTVFRSLNWTAAQKKTVKNYHQEMQVHVLYSFDSNFKKGETYNVIGKTSKTVILQNSKGEDISLNPRYFKGQLDVGCERRIGICPGDKLICKKNDPELGLQNNEQLTVKEVQLNGVITVEKIKDGKSSILTMPESFNYITHGYATTSHKSQGASKSFAIVVAPQMDAIARYVSLTRAKVRTSLFVPNKQGFIGDKKSNTFRRRISALDERIAFLKKWKLYIERKKARIRCVIKNKSLVINS